jgi:hypothetical protein
MDCGVRVSKGLGFRRKSEDMDCGASRRVFKLTSPFLAHDQGT